MALCVSVITLSLNPIFATLYISAHGQCCRVGAMVKKMNRANSLTGGERLSMGGRKTDLVRRLQQTHSCLKALSQDDRPEGLVETAKDLMGLGLMTHEDRDVRLLVACCLVDVLRVYAPEAPYSPVQLQQIFSLFTQQLRGLSTAADAEDARSQRTHYILESLATVKSCVILTELSQQGVPGGEEELVSFFECLLSEVREEHSQSVINHVVEALDACLEELDVFTQPLLDVLLVGLLPISRRDVPKMHAVTVQLLRRSFNRICNPISQFLNGVLSGSARGIGGAESELSDHVLHLIYELHKVNSGFLLYVLPNVAVQLQSEDLGGRGEAMSLLARLFSSTHANYANDYQKNWNDFLGRFKDVEAGVRGKMVEYGTAILTKKPELRSCLWEHMELRLSDPDWEVRRKTVHELCDLAVNCIEAVNVSIMKKIGERLRDKSLQIRKDTVTGLAQVYARHVSETWCVNRKKEGPKREEKAKAMNETEKGANNIFLQESYTVEDMWPTNTGTDSWEKLHWIPSDVIKCFAYPESEMKLRVLQLLDEILLPKLGTEWVRAAGAVYLVSSLDTQAFEGLKRILEYRATLRGEVTHYLQVRNMLRSHPEDADAKKALMASFATLGRISDKKNAPIQKLNIISDQHVFVRLKAVCAPRSSTVKISEAKSDLLKRVGSRSLLGEYIRTLTRSCAMLSFGSDMLSGVLDVLLKSINIRDVKGIRSALQIITCCAEIHPGELNVPVIVCNLLEAVRAVQEAEDEKSLSEVLYALECVAGRKKEVGCGDSSMRQHACELRKVLEANHQKASDLSKRLRKAVLDGKQGDGGGGIASEGAISLMKVLFPDSQELTVKLINELGKRVIPRGPQCVPALLSLGALSEAFPLIFESCPAGKRAVKFSRGALLQLRSSEGSADSRGCDCYCACITLLGRKLLPSKEGDEAGRQESIELLDVMYDIMGDRQVKTLSPSHSPYSSFSTRESDAKLRLAAALATVRLMQVSHLQTLLSPQRWKFLGYMLLDKSEVLRQAFQKEVCMLVTEAKVPLRFYAYLCLVAGSSVEARLALQKGVRNVRVAAAQSQLLKDNGEQPGPVPPTVMVPEYVLPYAIHLLAHHPQFNTMGEKSIRKHLVPVLGILRFDGATDNLSFLFHISETIVSSYCDALPGGDTLSLMSVAQLACEILQLSVKVQDNLTAYPGTIFLPKHLYRPRRPSDGPAPVSRLRKFYAAPSSRAPPGAAAQRQQKARKKSPKRSPSGSIEKSDGSTEEEDDEERSEDSDSDGDDSSKSISLERHEDQKKSRSERARVRSDRKTKNHPSVANVEEEDETVSDFKRNGKENDATTLHKENRKQVLPAKKKKSRLSL